MCAVIYDANVLNTLARVERSKCQLRNHPYDGDLAKLAETTILNVFAFQSRRNRKAYGSMTFLSIFKTERVFTCWKISPLHRTNALDMGSIARCFCSCAVWTRALWGQWSRTLNCYKMATWRRAVRAEIFHRNLKRSVRLKAERIPPKIPEKMD